MRDAFSESVHGKSASAIKAFWQRQIFSGRGTPPAEKDSSEAVLAFVAGEPAAVGYIDAETDTGGTAIKILQVTP